MNALLSDYSCPKNEDVEIFLKKNAIEFTKKNQSITYLILSNENSELLGYFTLAIKPLTIKADKVTKETKKVLSRFSHMDEHEKTYTISAYLIAQLGKNFSIKKQNQINGEEILTLAINQIKEVQFQIGGKILFLEAENVQKLQQFYEKTGLKSLI